METSSQYISSDLISFQEPICCNSHPFSCLGYFFAARQLGLHFGIETRVDSSWYWWVISTWTQVLEDQVVSVCFSINFNQQQRSHWWWRVILITLPNGSLGSFFIFFSFSSAVSPLFYRMQSCISSDNGGPGNCQSLAPWRPRSLKCS